MTAPPAPHPLTCLMVQQGWGKAEFARIMQRHGRQLGINLGTSRTTVWKWEQGQTPDEDAQRVLADLLGIPFAHVRATRWPRWLPVWEVPMLSAAWTEDGTVEALTRLGESGRMDRRGFLTITGGALAGVAASWAAAEPAFAAALDGDRVTDQMVTTIEQRVETLKSLDAQFGGATLLEHAQADLALITGLLKAGRSSEHVKQRLYSLSARVSYMTGWMAYDAGRKSAAQQYYVGALRSARTAGDDAFGCFMLAEMGVHVSDDGHTKDRVDLITTAVDNAPKALPPSTQSYLHLHKAEAHSRHGEHRKAGEELHRSLSLWDRADSSETPDWLSWYGDAQVRSTEGKVMLRSGQVKEATDALEESIKQAVPRDKAVRSSRLAEARLQGSDLEGALDAANNGAELVESGVSSKRAVDRLKEFSTKLTPHSHVPAVREFRDRLRELPALAA
ncbi:transcriptional regulator [Streptomyces alkaliterrae]|uniref:Transcriptional regulator n=1 Tax=Streptomyces alkaliterrae TaxID=2213162 RepID=A0A5P0YN38_9ACTN|nr:transcriptional regulator [Streptomyces alkaliterrae]MBB1259388.1 transcriptional regulator [Streptomyces alkaliterrae]MQS01763.1 transcriptional regulator [Streptomyces alkaliterrae]